MYRVAKKTSLRTRGYCLDCKYHKILREYPDSYGTIIECTAPNRCITGEFNSNDFYCLEYKGLNDCNEIEKQKIKNANRLDYAKKEFREYTKKYFTKEQAKNLRKEKKWTNG